MYELNTTYAQAEAERNVFVSKVYGWMGLGLLMTGITAWATASTPALLTAVVGTPLMWMLLIAELGLVFVISGMIQRLSSATASVLYVVYSILTGLTLSVIFVAYTKASIASTFMVAAGMFGGMCFIGFVTRRDLTKLGGILLMALFGLILATIVNLFMKSDAMQMIIAYIGVLIFAGLTAYDAQKIRLMGESVGGYGSEVGRKAAIIGALSFYLDFINIFLFLLQIMGRRRD